MGLYSVIREAKKRRISKIEIEGDNITVVKALQGNRSCLWEIEITIVDSRVSLRSFEAVKIKHVPRHCNVFTDVVVRLRHSFNCFQIKYSPELMVLIRKDALG